jgi:hypothetical protein
MAVAAAAAALALAGCSDLQNSLGLGKSSPDEFDVVRHAALALPPNYDLRPPAPGAPRPQQISPREVAREALLGPDAGQAAPAPAAPGAGGMSQTPGERALLRQSGAGEVPVNIREVVRIEAAALGVQDRSFTDSLLFWKAPDKDQVLDPVAEAERLKRQQEGAPPVPSDSGVVIKRKKSGLFGGSLF